MHPVVQVGFVQHIVQVILCAAANGQERGLYGEHAVVGGRETVCVEGKVDIAIKHAGPCQLEYHGALGAIVLQLYPGADAPALHRICFEPGKLCVEIYIACSQFQCFAPHTIRGI